MVICHPIQPRDYIIADWVNQLSLINSNSNDKGHGEKSQRIGSENFDEIYVISIFSKLTEMLAPSTNVAEGNLFVPCEKACG
jgi:hypothetical protein